MSVRKTLAAAALAAASLFTVAPTAHADVPGGLGDVTGDGAADILGTIDQNMYQTTDYADWNGHTQEWSSYMGGYQWYPRDPIRRGVKLKAINPDPAINGAPQRKALGWGTATTIAPLPDMNGDRLSDHLLRFGSHLYIYYGRGNGNFVRGPEVGHGWGGMDNITYAGNLNGDSGRYIIARGVTDARLYAYKVSGNGAVEGMGQIGKGWGNMRFILGPGQQVGDAKADLSAIDYAGNMYCYAGIGGGRIAEGIPCGRGWTGYDKALIAGDMDGDGRYDLVSRFKVPHANSQGEPIGTDATQKTNFDLRGSLYYYKNLGNGSWGPKQMIGYDFYMFRHIS